MSVQAWDAISCTDPRSTGKSCSLTGHEDFWTTLLATHSQIRLESDARCVWMLDYVCGGIVQLLMAAMLQVQYSVHKSIL